MLLTGLEWNLIDCINNHARLVVRSPIPFDSYRFDEVGQERANTNPDAIETTTVGRRSNVAMNVGIIFLPTLLKPFLVLSKVQIYIRQH